MKKTTKVKSSKTNSTKVSKSISPSKNSKTPAKSAVKTKNSAVKTMTGKSSANTTKKVKGEVSKSPRVLPSKKVVKTDHLKAKSPVKKIVAEPQVENKKAIKTMPSEKASKIENKGVSSVKVLAQGSARVIEPLSWDAEKPKLNMSLNQKITRKEKEKEKEESEVKSYNIKSRYTVGDRVMHTDFGKGLVRDLIGDFKIRVAFRDYEKVLVHGIN